MKGNVTTPAPAEPEAGVPAIEQAPNTLPANDPQFRRALWTAAGNLTVDLGYHYRACLIAGQRMRADAKLLQVPRVVLPVLASAGTATLALVGLNGLAVVFGFVGAIMVALEKHFDPVGQANAHTDKGDRLLGVYKDLLYFQNVKLRSAKPSAELEPELAQLRKRADDLRMLEPRQLPPYAYPEARRQVADGQSEYFGDPLWRDPPDDV